MRQPRTSSDHQPATDSDALVIGRDGVVRGATLDRLGVNLLVVHFGENRQGRVRIQELTVAHPEGVTGSLLRRLPLERIEKQHNRTRTRSVGWYGEDSAGPLANLQRLLDTMPSPPRGSERVYKAVAAVYHADVRNGVRTPARTITTATGLPLNTVRGWIHRARLLGYLPPARRGAAG